MRKRALILRVIKNITNLKKNLTEVMSERQLYKSADSE